MALWQEDNVSISHLAKKAGLSKATMTPLLKRLEQKQFIKRELLPDNERQKNIVLTKQGRALSKHSGEITEKVFCATTLTEKQAHQMISLCHKITQTDQAKS
jgi:DNA-binding MarR family transcriptional regulator